MEDLILSIDYGSMDKEAMEPVSQNPNNWDVDVAQQFYAQHPKLVMAYSFEVDWVKKDERLGYGWGAIILSSEPENPTPPDPMQRMPRDLMGSGYEEKKVAVPVVIKDFALAPLDLFIVDGKILPLTEKRLAEYFSVGNTFAGLDYSNSPDTDELSEHLLPPVEATYESYGNLGGLAGGGLGSFASDGSGKYDWDNPPLLESILPTIKKADSKEFGDKMERSPVAMTAFALNNKLDTVLRIRNVPGTDGGDIYEILNKALVPDIVHFTKGSDGVWRALRISDEYYDPVMIEYPEDKMVTFFKPDIPDIQSLLDGSDNVVWERAGRKTVDPIVLEDLDVKAEPIESSGTYMVVGREGKVFAGKAYPKVMNYDMSPTPWKLFSDGQCFGFTDNLLGHKFDEDPGKPKEGEIKQGCCGTWRLDKGEGGAVVTVPFKVRRVRCDCDSVTVLGWDHFGNEVTFIVSPGCETFKNVTGVTDMDLGGEICGNVFLVPQRATFIKLGKYVTLSDDPDQLKKEIYQALADKIHLNRGLSGDNDPTSEKRTVQIQAYRGLWTLKGSVLNEITHQDKSSDLDKNTALRILMSLGFSKADSTSLLDRANNNPDKPLHVGNVKVPKDVCLEKGAKEELSELIEEKLAFDSFKAAESVCRAMTAIREASVDKTANAFLPTEEEVSSNIIQPNSDSLDTVLSLGFINEENIGQFVQAVPELRECEERLAELVLYTRIGLPLISEEGASRALKHFNSIVEQLEELQSLLMGNYV